MRSWCWRSACCTWSTHSRVRSSRRAILFGLVYGFLANAWPELLFGSPFLLAVGFAMLGGLAVLARLYWFRVPFAGVLTSLTCYLSSIVAWWI